MIEIDYIFEVEHHLDGIDGVIFDLDDTLYSEKDYVRSGYREVAKAFPHIHEMDKKLWKAFEKGQKAFDEVFTSEGLLTEENLSKAIDVYRNHKPDIRLYDGVWEMILRLKKNGKKIGMITDGRPEGQWAKIESLGIKNLFDEIIITDELGGIEYRKPNETAFVRMSERLRISYSRLIYVGDNINKDFISPEKLGMQSCYFENVDGLYYKNTF